MERLEILARLDEVNRLPIMSSKKSDRIEVFSLVIQVHTSHKPWIPMYRIRE